MKEGKKQFLFVKNKLSEIKTFDVIIEDHQKWVETRNRLAQGHVKKWTEHSQELHLLKRHSRGGSYYTPGLDGVDFLDHELL